MKNKILALAFAVSCLAVVTGCKTAQTLDRMLFTPAAYATNITAPRVVTVVTNREVVTVATNAAGAVSYATSREPVNVTFTLPGTTNITPSEWQPNAAAVAALQGAGSLVPGYGQLVALGGTALLGLLAQLRSRRYRAAALSVARSVTTILETVPDKGAALAELKNTQNANGTRETVRKLLSALPLAFLLCFGISATTAAEAGEVNGLVKPAAPRLTQRITKAKAKSGAVVLTQFRYVAGTDGFPSVECFVVNVPPGTNTWKLLTIRPGGFTTESGPVRAPSLIGGCRPAVTNEQPVVFVLVSVD